VTDYNLGTVRGRIEIDASGAESGAKKAEQAVGGLKGGLDKFSKSAGGLATASAAVGAAGGLVAAGFAGAVNSAVSYEKRLSAIKAVSGATESDMKGLSDTALRIGKDTSFSANEAASAIEELAKAGLSVPDIMNGAADATVALAAAGEVDLPEAATIASNAMNQFNLAAADMPNVADKIAGAANASAIDVKDFGYSLSQAGAVASLTGFSFDDLSVAIAEMGNAGIKGSDAGTSLKTFMSNLIPTTKDQIQLFEQLGFVTVGNADAMKKLADRGIKPASASYDDVRDAISKYVEASGQGERGSSENNKATERLGTSLGALKNQFFDAQGNVKSMAEVQGLLQDKTKGLTKEQKLATLQTLFGSDAIRAAAVLADEGADGYNKMSASMGKVTAAGVAQERLNNLSGMWENLKGSVETIGIEIGRMLIPVLKSVVKFLMSMANAWNNLAPRTKKIIVIVAAVVAGMLLLLSVLAGIAAAIAGVVAAFSIAGGIALPILGVLAAIVAVVAIVVVLAVVIYKNWDRIKAVTVSVFTSIRDFFVSIFTGIRDFFVSVFTAIGAFFVAFWASLRGMFEAGVAGVQAIWSTAWGFVSGVVIAVFTAIKNFFVGAFLFIQNVFVTALAFIQGLWAAFWNGPFGQLIQAVFGLINAAVNYGLSAISVAIQTALTFIGNLWNTVWTAVSGFFVSIWTSIVGFIAPILAAIRDKIAAALNFVKNLIIRVLTAYRNLFVSAWNFISTRTQAAFNAVRDRIQGPLRTVQAFVGRSMATIKSTLSNAWSAVSSTASRIWTNVYNGIRDKINSIISKVQAIKSRVQGALAGAASWLYNAGKNIIQGLINGVVSMITRLTDKLHAITRLIPDHKGPPAKDKILLESAGEDVMQGFINGINNSIGHLEGTLGGITNAVPGMMKASATPAAAPAFISGAGGGTTYSKTVNISQKNYNPITKPDSVEINESLQLGAALLEV